MRVEYMLGLLAIHTKRWTIYFESRVSYWAFGFYKADRPYLEIIWTLDFGPITITRALPDEVADENYRKLRGVTDER